MASVINTNVASINAQRNLNASSTSLGVALQRLSSGLRINTAKDDAAGLAISERFTTQIRGLNQAVRNANDGISLAQSGEGALGELTQNMQRVRELALQSVNATNSNTDRAAIDLEVQQRLQEIDRVAAQTQFNGRNLLDGSFGSATFQVGANVGQTIGIDLQTSMRLDDIGAMAKSESVDITTLDPTAATLTTKDIAAFNFATVPGTPADYTTGDISGKLGATDLGAGFSFDITYNGQTKTITVGDNSGLYANVGAVATAIGTQLTASGIGVTVAADTNALKFTAGGNAASSISISNFTGGGTTVASTFTTPAAQNAGTADNTSANKTFTVQGPGGAATTVTLNTNTTNIAGLVSAISGQLSGSGVTVAADGNKLAFTAATPGAGKITVAGKDAALITNGATSVAGQDMNLTLADGDLQIAIGEADAVKVAAGTYTRSADLVSAINLAMGGNAQAAMADGKLVVTSNEDITVTAGGDATQLGLADAAVGGSLTGGNVKTVASSNELIQRVDAALKQVSDLRSVFGAVQNRFESAVANMQATSENLTASRSRIQDADFAQETANLTRSQILQQAGIAMLSQANSMPNMVLSLLR